MDSICRFTRHSSFTLPHSLHLDPLRRQELEHYSHLPRYLASRRRWSFNRVQRKYRIERNHSVSFPLVYYLSLLGLIIVHCISQCRGRSCTSSNHLSSRHSLLRPPHDRSRSTHRLPRSRDQTSSTRLEDRLQPERYILQPKRSSVDELTNAGETCEP